MAEEEQADYFNIYQFNEESFHSILTKRDFDNQEVDKHRHVEYLFRYLQKLNTKCLVVEEDYTDIDYVDSFANYYSSCHVKYSRSCRRVHAFSIDSFDKEHFSKLVIDGDFSQDQIHEESSTPSLLDLMKSYLGFIVILPLPETFIGRTILATQCNTLNPGDIRNYSCTRSYDVNLFGIKLSISNSLAFQQQDQVIMACASVAIWCALHRVSDLFDIALPRPSAITKAAVASYASSRGFPSKGLTAEQICKAIVHFGLEPEVISVPNKQDLPILSLIYGYLRMGIPIILGCDVAKGSSGVNTLGEIHGGHAITLVGYKITKESKVTKEKQLVVTNDPTKMISLRMSSLYAHDDQQGPFSKLDVLFNEEVLSLEGDQKKLKYRYHPIVLESQYDNINKEVVKFYPTTLIIPAYHKIRVPFIDIYANVAIINDMLLDLLNPLGDKNPVNTDTLEWDVYLTTTNDLKNDLRDVMKKYINIYRGDEDGFDQYLKLKLEDMMLSSHPRFIWRGTLRGINDSKDIVEILDFFADATGVANAFPIYDIVWYEPTISNFLREFMADSSEVSLRERKKLKKSLVEFICKNLGVVENES